MGKLELTFPYDIGELVWIKPLGTLGRIREWSVTNGTLISARVVYATTVVLMADIFLLDEIREPKDKEARIWDDKKEAELPMG